MEQRQLVEMSEAEVLAFAGARHRDRLDAEVDVFRAAYQWSVLHNPDRLDPDESGKPGRERGKQIAGPGTPMVTEYAAATSGARITQEPRSPSPSASSTGQPDGPQRRASDNASRAAW